MHDDVFCSYFRTFTPGSGIRHGGLVGVAGRAPQRSVLKVREQRSADQTRRMTRQGGFQSDGSLLFMMG
jgi:hypothetical protein